MPAFHSAFEVIVLRRIVVPVLLLSLFAVSLAAAEKPVAVNDVPGTWDSGTYVYDGGAHITRIGDDTYTQDALGRIVRAGVHSGGALTTDVYRYDAFGNLHRRITTSASGTSEQPIAVSWSTNQITDGTYDGAGNLTGGAGGPYTYGWDAMKMMATLTGNGRNDVYIYGPGDERIATKSGDKWKLTLRDFEGNVLRVVEKSGEGAWVWVEDVVHRDRQVAGTERPAAQGGRRHFHLDHIGSVRLITDDDGRGVSRHDYLPFGIELTSIRQAQERGLAENAFRFAGHERDFTGGTLTENSDSLDYMHARHYKSTLGRFLSVDRAQADASRPQSWNRYAYAINNGIKYVDKNGNYYELASAADRKFFVDAMVRGSRNKAAREMMQRHAADPYKRIGLATGNLPGARTFGDASKIQGPHTVVNGNLFPSGVTTTVDSRKLALVSYPTPTISVFHEIKHADTMLYQGLAVNHSHPDQIFQHPVTGAITTNSIFEDFGRAAEYNNDDPMNALSEAQVNSMIHDPGEKPEVEQKPPCVISILCVAGKGN